ncbi:hypothetical protein MSBRW_3108 [Methanosarcina barkeri str. Wiesmoor]|uniref:Uncharacterized protein n=2 Tax=Methanosarcina barkeri TaxID=2208 RepID=A0A0E3LM41_METBA|nr:hypothetical protein MSBRW_3108 [Methanosarcina barkeri str. Wiesmoor]
MIPNWLVQGVVTGIILPIIYFPVNAYLSNKFSNDLPAEGKNAYKNFLIKNSKPINDLFRKLDEYKNNTQMKYFYFLEGMPLGIMCSIILLMFSFFLSQLRELNKFDFFLPYYNYAYNGQKDIDLVRIVLSLNVFTIIITALIFLFIIFSHFKGYTNPKVTEKLSLTRWSKYIHYSYWLSTGLIIGLNMNELLFVISFKNQFIKVITNLPNYKIFVLLILYLICLFSSWFCIFILYDQINDFSDSVKQLITDFYIDDFPYIRVKTNGEDISGKIDDIHNETLIILKEVCSLKAIRWDQITTMEIEKQGEDSKLSMRLLPKVTENKPWWKFW